MQHGFAEWTATVERTRARKLALAKRITNPATEALLTVDAIHKRLKLFQQWGWAGVLFAELVGMVAMGSIFVMLHYYVIALCCYALSLVFLFRIMQCAWKAGGMLFDVKELDDVLELAKNQVEQSATVETTPQSPTEKTD